MWRKYRNVQHYINIGVWTVNHLQLEYFSSPKICDLLHTSLPFPKEMGSNSIYLFIPAGSSNAFWVMWFSIENFVLEMCMDICVYKRRCNKSLRYQYWTTQAHHRLFIIRMKLMKLLWLSLMCPFSHSAWMAIKPMSVESPLRITA